MDAESTVNRVAFKFTRCHLKERSSPRIEHRTNHELEVKCEALSGVHVTAVRPDVARLTPATLTSSESSILGLKITSK
jgi:hypothetical protein